MKRFLDFQAHNTSMRTETIAGVTTFLTTMYIIVVNPSILQNTGMSFNGVLTATVLVSAFSSIMMGLYAKNPIVLAPGMGINAFFAFSVVIGMNVAWEQALGAVFWSGVVFLILSIFNVRTSIVRAIPRQIRFGIAAGIGIFIALIGLKNAGFIAANPATLVSLGELNALTLTFLAGLFVTSVLIARRIKGALILGIVITTILSLPIGRLWGDASALGGGSVTLVGWKGFVAAPDFSVFARLDLIGSLRWAMFPVIFTFLFTDMFDSIATFIGVAEAGKLTEESGDPRNMKQSLIVDAVATMLSGLFGTSPATSYIESATGIEEGGRTGLTAVIAGLLFLPFMFFSPLISIIPDIATAPALVLVGVFMMKPVLRIRWDEFDTAIPVFLGMVLIPLTFSITQGIIWGFLSWTIIKVCTGKVKDISPMLIVIDIFAVLALTIKP